VPHCIVYTNDDIFYILWAMLSLDQMNKNKMKWNKPAVSLSKNQSSILRIYTTDVRKKWVLTSSWARWSKSDIFCTFFSSQKSSMNVLNKFIIEHIKFASEDSVSSCNEKEAWYLLASEILGHINSAAGYRRTA
jgi:hypothetical protein